MLMRQLYLRSVPNKKSKIAAMKGKKQVGAISSAERGETTTAVMCMSATGHVIPPFLIFPRARMNDSLKNGTPSGTEFACNPSGYMTVDIFCAWFDHFLHYVHPKADNPVLLVVDGHSSHTKNLAVTEKARVNHVTIIVLPPHCSNKLQPLDVSFMAPFKNYYTNAAETFLRNNPGRVITVYEVGQLMSTAFTKAATTLIAVNGFKKTGLWPCNREIFDDTAFAPSLVTDQSEKNLNSESSSKQDMQNNSTTQNVADGQLENMPRPSRTSYPQNPNTSFEVPPSVIIPLPQITTARSSRKCRSGKAAEITSTSHAQCLIRAKAAKDIKAIKLNQKKTARKQ
uniref:DDE-1 domain-containing protein n=1 Tax=Anopheles dirus TaxID=7168 RepID=A0A182NVN1_9DIPT